MEREKPSNFMRRLLGLFFLGLLAWWGILRLSSVRAQLAESNYQSNLIRIERALFGASTGETFLLGSSITGRLLPEMFEGLGLGRVGNLGLDGSGPALGLELLANLHPSPKRIMIEANLLAIPSSRNDQLLRNSVKDWGFRLSRKLPWLRAETRPSSLLYSFLKGHRRENIGRVSGDHTGSEVRAPAIAPEVFMKFASPEEYRIHAENVRRMIDQWLSRGTEVWLIRYPQGDAEPDPKKRKLNPLDLADLLENEKGLRQIELANAMMSPGTNHRAEFTDGTHLSESSARVAAQFISEAVRQGDR